MSKNNEFRAMNISSQGEVEQLISVLTVNGYEVRVTPVYETIEDLKKESRRPYPGQKPRVKYCTVSIVGEIQQPELEV